MFHITEYSASRLLDRAGRLQIVTGDRNSDYASSDKVHWVGFQPNAFWQEREAGVIVQDRWRSGVQTTSLDRKWALAHLNNLSVKKGDGTIWPEELFCDELNILDRHLGIHDDFDILGHS
ncbi:hypothetical protein BU17DRAFT_72330 [Hysterangium stoloniferum]|nr:hypothetical protein BU17DRAFT_72330 [Hysterangium stoloniferum]